MNGCFDTLFSNNCCLWILIILLVILLAKCGCLNGIFNSCYCLPIALLILCCCNKGGSLFGCGNNNCGCK
ncbi:MAG: chorion class high-cysteine HCB protein 13 [Clostridia bacterium]|nr:chorion class high-cysteine HCB protein 13 [Clostridia bacterium]